MNGTGPWTQGAPAGAAPPQEAVIFDLDGVVTDTAQLHAVAWKHLFDEVLADPRSAGAGPQPPFDVSTDYRRYVDGRSREDGVRAFLAARGILLPLGEPDDPADSWTVHGLAARKQAIYLQLLSVAGVKAYPGTVGLLDRLVAGGVRLALVTASRNAGTILAAAALDKVFNVVVDGNRAAELGLAGKPDPAMFLEAARELGVAPARAAVVEDAAAGIRAARRGGFGMVVGIDRGGQRASLEQAGADVVVTDAAQLDLGSLRADPWVLVYEGFDPMHEGHREALTTLGNGYLGTRGAAPEHASDGVHYPGTYLAGVYNRLSSVVHERRMDDEHLVNVPNWLVLDVAVGDGRWWSEGGLTIAAERRELDMRDGVLTRTGVLRDASGRRLHVTQRRVVSMARAHLCGLETTLVADGWDGAVRVRSAVDAGVRNGNVAEYRELANRHLRTLTSRLVAAGTMLVEVETTQSHIRVATAARTTVTGATAAGAPVLEQDGDRCGVVLEVALHDGRPVTIDKTVAVFTSRDSAIASPGLAATDELLRAPDGVASLLPAHRAAWAQLWDRFGLELDADRQTRLALNLHVFHVLQSVSAHTAQLDAGIPARGLHGEGYRGHVFWDELFVLPVLTAHQPWLTRSLLGYRFHRLDAARDRAAIEGLRGASFPWQSGSDGREETPAMLFNPRSGRWVPDNSRRQRHVGLAVAYNAWKYFQATGDVAWLGHRGADLIIEVARFFASLATYEPGDDRFHIEGVMGPDEYHDGYPASPGAGLRDNAYTNVLASWVLRRAIETLELTQGHDCDELHERLGIRSSESEHWARVASRLAVSFHDGGIISQFAGYADLEELDWPGYRARYGNIGRLDLILEAEDDTTNRYKLAKQADVLMLVYVLGADVLLQTLHDMGYEVPAEALARTIDYYLQRTAHGSTLSRVVHASVLARADPSRSWETFREALAADLDDTQGGTTGEGIHLGAMAGTADVVMRSFAGFRTDSDVVVLEPRLPQGLRCARFALLHRGQRLDVRLDRDSVSITADPCASNPHVRVRVRGRTATIAGGQRLVFPEP